ncbi:aldose epimerase family protein [Malacoplasma iowae]|uniref:UDP-glucose--hexose-1-phosphate uridylyltransferase n=1 Tax=Malacoplasma iowae DK-CPA TaxID=1394179 RepID=A0A084U3F2_MALIO|nr:hypothetical protein [Malacoplasma iowae]KFB07488.1 galactose-1-phosphate uridylyltransferase/galactose mutarotase [Malacoplasma iowae DK-CPA]WPL37150.1 hypothetical protein QX179_01570 [Malacoplasma iowae]WPL37731.1 hypothetical protein QX182_04485 [Malacoplasma iowae]WPL40707.1 hypothetical protein QX184_04185 [Malacoplasma iowae]
MVLVALNKITNRFLNENIISLAKAKDIFNFIKQELNIDSNQKFIFDKNIKTNYKEHFFDIDVIRQHLASTNQLSNQEIENKINYLMSLFLTDQKKLNKILSDNNPFEYLKKISLLSYYIKKDKNDKNLIWNLKSKYGNMRISINKAKPEKTIDEIKKAREAVQINNKDEPKCPICIENIGYKGNASKDSRENLRVYFIDFPNNQKWFLQYSPYAYLNDHFVINNINHQPMKISFQTVDNLLDFVDKNPLYFLGSNADLPIVGGSLLSHDHYQGGKDKLPLMNAKTIRKIKVSNETYIHQLNWPLNAIKIVSNNKEETACIAKYIINNWKHFQNKKLVNKDNNSSTLIVNKINDKFHFYIILRNNSVSQNRPFGNFHFHQDKFNIKQENIGLMEAAGLAILPVRLESELLQIVNILNTNNIDEIKNHESLSKHYEWVNSLLSKNKKIDEKNIFKYASDVFVNGLEDCKVLSKKEFELFLNNLFLNQDISLINKNKLKIVINKIGFSFKEISLKEKNYLLQYENSFSYYSNSILLNSFVGPIAGRVENKSLNFNDQIYDLPLDEKNNYLHSNGSNLSHLVFNFSNIKKDKMFLSFNAYKDIYVKELDTFYKVKINFKLLNHTNKMVITYNVLSNKKSYFANPTQHFYFQLPSDENINDYLINIDHNDSFYNLSKNMNPLLIKNIKLKNEFNSIWSISNELNEEQHKIVGGYIDHPFKSNKDKIILKNNYSQIILKSEIKDFVIYTHNFASYEKVISTTKKQNHLGVCVEFQKTPISINLNNSSEIKYELEKPYKNKIEIEIN